MDDLVDLLSVEQPLLLLVLLHELLGECLLVALPLCLVLLTVHAEEHVHIDVISLKVIQWGSLDLLDISSYFVEPLACLLLIEPTE